MSRVFYNQSGYIGISMSERASEAYASGEMPKSKWTKKAILSAIRETCDDNDLVFAGFEDLKKDELFERYFYCSSWHHTGKFAQETDFYAVDEEAVLEVARPMTSEEIKARETEREKARKQAVAEREQARAASLRKTKEDLKRITEHKAYYEVHGFEPTSAAAFAETFPERCNERVSKKGNVLLCMDTPLGYREVVKQHAATTTIDLFDATKIKPPSRPQDITSAAKAFAEKSGSDNSQSVSKCRI